jgi:hypothetical protein
MDTTTYLAELLGSFDGDISALSEQSSGSSGSGGSPDRSGSSGDGSMAVDGGASDSSLFLSPPMRSARRPAASPALPSPALIPSRVLPASSAAASASNVAARPAAPAASSSSAASRSLQVPEAKQPEHSASRSHGGDEDLKMRHRQLKKNYQKQGEELARTTKLHDDLLRTSARERDEMQDRVRSLEHKAAMLESQLQKAQLEFNHALSTKQSELTALSSSLRSAQQQLQDQNPDVLKQIEYVKDDLSDLTTSEAMYLEFKAIEPHRQTIREYVCCQVYELLRSERSLKEAMQKELELVRIKCIQAEDEGERCARERDQIARLKKVSVELSAQACAMKMWSCWLM